MITNLNSLDTYLKNDLNDIFPPPRYLFTSYFILALKIGANKFRIFVPKNLNEVVKPTKSSGIVSEF